MALKFVAEAGATPHCFLVVNSNKTAMKTSFFTFIALLFMACKKENHSCKWDSCDNRRKTVITANNWQGTLAYYNDVQQWAIHVPIANTIDGLRTCFLCTTIPDSLQHNGKIVSFSGQLKESCGSPLPQLKGQEIYFVQPGWLE
jgi:hypothetical protein